MSTQTNSNNYNSGDFVNAMPHPFNLFATVNDAKADSVAPTLMTVPPSGSVARLVEEKNSGGIIPSEFTAKYPYGFPPKFGGVEGLPAEGLEDKVLIVSMLVGEYYRSNPDRRPVGVKHVVGPDSGAGAVRDAKGAIVGTTKFVVYA
jgi:hypothetical protein